MLNWLKNLFAPAKPVAESKPTAAKKSTAKKAPAKKPAAKRGRPKKTSK